MNKIEMIPVTGISEILPNDNLFEKIFNQMEKLGISYLENDILCIAQKIVSKAENRYVDLNEIQPSEDAMKIAKRDNRDPRLVEVVIRESNEIIVATEKALIVEHHTGMVCAHAGIDRSNLPENENIVLLLPKNADLSAAKIRKEVFKKKQVTIAVVIVDTQGRAFRRGVVGVSIGSSGIESISDLRGKADRFGKPLLITILAQADEIAAAASSVMGQADESIPAVIMRGMNYRRGDIASSQLYRSKDEDLFRK
ncbi:MAG: coenzyme F420-0:L-glutamate ligase [Nitrospinota bacterium]|nr:coenzyme F420-0:L-glutamate ligase [Nitrospinota bacterium]